MLEILKIYENVVFGLRKWPPKNVPEHEFSKMRSSPVKNAIAKVWDKNTFFARPGPLRVRLGRKKMTDDDFAWRIRISRSQCLKSSKYMKM